MNTHPALDNMRVALNRLGAALEQSSPAPAQMPGAVRSMTEEEATMAYGLLRRLVTTIGRFEGAEDLMGDLMGVDHG